MDIEDAESITEEMPDELINEKIDCKLKYDFNETIQPHVKIAIIGESGCGKSSLILAAKNQIFPHPDEKFVSKQYVLDIEVDGKTEACLVADTDAGDDNIDKRRKIYSETNVVLMCFDEIKTLADVQKKWVRELKAHIPEVPVILVRVKKTKLETDILSSEFKELDIFSDFLECCPHERKGVQRIFQEALKKART